MRKRFILICSNVIYVFNFIDIIFLKYIILLTYWLNVYSFLYILEGRHPFQIKILHI